MGQYYLIVNMDRKQYLHPHRFGDGLKLLEFGCSGDGTMCGLAVLLADGNGGGGGDLHSTAKIIGSWAGNRIVVAGDYADPGRFIETGAAEEAARRLNASSDRGRRGCLPEELNLYGVAEATYTDVSDQVIAAMADDAYLRQALMRRSRFNSITGKNEAVVVAVRKARNGRM